MSDLREDLTVAARLAGDTHGQFYNGRKAYELGSRPGNEGAQL